MMEKPIKYIMECKLTPSRNLGNREIQSVIQIYKVVVGSTITYLLQPIM